MTKYFEVFIKHKPYYFILDCGAVNVINSSLARDLDLPIHNLHDGLGAGSALAQFGSTTLDTLTFG